MTTRMDIWRAAKLLVDQHGADAKARTVQRLGEMLTAGDMEAHAVWLRILDAVEELLGTRGPGSVH